MTTAQTHLTTADGLRLEAEWNTPAAENIRATAVLCHPHPQYGGTMRSIVISALFEALPQVGIACLRFNFRGVENSEGAYSEGRAEPLDVIAAMDAAGAAAEPNRILGEAHHRVGAAPATRRDENPPVVLVGWSFGADMALSVNDERITAWVGIAPPLRFRPENAYDAVGADPRPKLLVLAANDEFRTPDDIAAETHGWAATQIEVVAGASHFFVGRTERVVTLVADFVGARAG